MCDMKCLQYSRSPPPSIQWVTPPQTIPTQQKLLFELYTSMGRRLPFKNKRIGTHVRFLLFSRVKSVVYMGEKDVFNSVPEEAIVPFLCCIGNRLGEKRNLTGTTLHFPLSCRKIVLLFCLCRQKSQWQYPCQITKNFAKPQNARFCSEKNWLFNNIWRKVETSFKRMGGGGGGGNKKFPFTASLPFLRYFGVGEKEDKSPSLLPWPYSFSL